LKVDEKGVKRAAAGRDDAAELFTRHAGGIYRYCLRRLGSPEEAEDALQITYLNAWRSLKDGCEPKVGRAWLFRIAANVCSSVLRARLGGTRLELRDPNALDELCAVEDPESDQLVGLSEALRELPSRQRRALVLRDWQGLSYSEIAAEMAVSNAAVETLLFRARNKVAATLANADWRRRLAPSTRALLVWPFAFLRAKSVATTGAGQLKLGLALAGGTVAPLVAFGLIQPLLLGPGERAEANRVSAIARASSSAVPQSWPQDGSLAHASSGPARNGATRVHGQEEPRRHHRSAHGGKKSSAHAPSTAAASPAAFHDSKIVVCHATHSDTRPGVTINVSKHALGGLDDDTRQACD
jgi:RNA polymerase sigma-70 factor (ECF subfamily)